VAEVVASNIGGASTLIGDPPNIIIAGASGLGFLGFFVHDAIGAEPPTVALGGAALYLLVGRLDVERALQAIEWPTLFFVGLSDSRTGRAAPRSSNGCVRPSITTLAPSPRRPAGSGCVVAWPRRSASRTRASEIRSARKRTAFETRIYG